MRWSCIFRALACSEQFIQAFSKILGVLWILMHIQSHSLEGNWDLPCSFWNPKKCPDFGKNGPDCVHLWIKFTIYNVVLRVFRTKISKMFLCGASFLLFLTECLSKCPTSTNPPPSIYASIFNHIQSLLRHSYGDIRHIQAYSSIHNLVIFWALAYLDLEAYWKPCETLIRYIQNPAMGHYSAIFRHVQNLVQCLHMQKPDILKVLEYSELIHNCIPMHIQNPVIFTNLQKFTNIQKPDIFKTWHIFRTLWKI